MSQRQQQRSEPMPIVADQDVDPTVPVARPARQVRVIAGADVQDMDLAGRRVADARVVAQALFGLHPNAVPVVDGRRVTDEHELVDGQVLEFVKHAGQKGAGSARTSTIELAEDRAVWRQNGREMGGTPVHVLLDRVAATGRPYTDWRLNPPHVRLMVERDGGRLVGTVIEMPPGPRVVKWIADGSDEEYGPDARYETRQLSFPWVVLVIVFANGELSGMQQAFFRNTPLASVDDPLAFTCLLNCADAPAYGGQESWVCLANLTRRLGRLSWTARVKTVTDHFWHAAFNRSSEVHEGNSYWHAAGSLDRRLASAEAWEAATRDDPYFALTIPWRRAPRPLGATLAGMLEKLAPWHPVERVEQLVTLMQQDGGR
jgi:hypothetical protein